MRPSPASPPRRATRLREVSWCLLVVLACAHFAIRYNWSNHQFLNLPQYAAGHERLPFQARVLMAWVFHATAASPTLGPRLAVLGQHLPVEFHSPYQIVMAGVVFLAMLLAIVSTRASIRMLTDDTPLARWASLLPLYMAYFNLVLLYGLSYTLPYDVPGLALFSAGLALVLRRNFLLYYPVFLLGTLNRETFCAVTLFFLIVEWSRTEATPPGRRLAAIAPHVVAQAVIWISVRLWLQHHFLDNPRNTNASGLFQINLIENVRSALNPRQWPLFLSLFGFTLPLVIAERRWIAPGGSPRLHTAVARATAVIVPLWFGLMFVVGVLAEIRIFNELSAILSLALALIAWHRWIQPARHGRREAGAAAP